MNGRKVITVGPRSAAETIIQFPGGSVSVMRTSEGDYWAHITRDRAAQVAPPWVGTLLAGRMDFDRTDVDQDRLDLLDSVRGITSDPALYHVALRIATKTGRKS